MSVRPLLQPRSGDGFARPRARRLTALGAALALCCGWTLIAAAAPASAAAQTRFVAVTGNDGVEPVNDCTDAAAPCRTVQHAVDVAAPADTVSVAAGTYAESVVIATSITLTGAGATSTIITGDGTNPSITVEPADGQDAPAVVIDGLGASHNTAAPGIAALGAQLSVVDSDVSGSSSGGLIALFSEVTVSGSTVTDNSVGTSTAPFATGSGITLALGTLTVDRSSISGNGGSGVLLAGAGLVGGIAPQLGTGVTTAAVSAVLRSSTVSANATGGVLSDGGDVAVDTSTVSGNHGGGIVGLGGTVGVTASTVTGTVPFAGTEVSTDEGGLLALPGSTGGQRSRLLPSTTQRAAWNRSMALLITAHPSAVRRAVARLAHPGAVAAADAADAVVTVSASIVAEQGGLPDCVGPIVDAGYNVSSDAANSCALSAAEHDLVRADPLLLPLADNGGPTQTQLLGKGSAAIDAVATGMAGCTAGISDQRGDPRPQPVGGPCDAGAVEMTATAIVISPATLPRATVGKPYRQIVTATGGAYPTYAWSLASGVLPAGLSFSVGGVITGTPTKAGAFTFVVSVNDPVLKTYTIVVGEPAPAPAATSVTPISAAPSIATTAPSSAAPLANTGSEVRPMTAAGVGAVLVGLLLLLGAARVGRVRGQHRGLR